MAFKVEFVHCISKQLLNLHCMLLGGQSFRWTEKRDNCFMGVVRNYVVQIEQHPTKCRFSLSSNVKMEESAVRAELEDYLQLNFPIEDFYKLWCQRDPNHFEKKARALPGVRMLRQDPFENVISFICSQNNHISRISQLVNKVCVHFGSYITTIDGQDFYAFPSLDDLLEVKDLEKRLRDLAFGYRAAYVSKAVQFLANQQGSKGGGGGEMWLNQLRDVSYEEAKTKLLQIPGIGPKVSDCVCLMSLDKTSAVPVDTHVLQIAQRDYRVGMNKGGGATKGKGGKLLSLTVKNYQTITDFFHELFGDYSGWAHTVLFCSDLREVPGKRKLEEQLGKTALKTTVEPVKEEFKPSDGKILKTASDEQIYG